MRRALSYVTLLLLAHPLRGQTHFEFNADAKLGYLNLYQQPFLPQNILGLELMLAAGVKGAYFFVKGSASSLKNNLRFLAGLSWQYLYENKVMFTPAAEYAYELDYHIVSGGFILEIKKVTLSFFVNCEINAEITRPGILVRIQWTLPHSLTLYATWQSFFWDKDNRIKHSLTARILWNI